MQYLQGASSGTVVAGGNGPGTNTSQLWLPFGFTLDLSTNSLIIANYAANNVVRWVIGATGWTLLAGSATGASGSSSTLLNNPVGVALDQYKNLYVADAANHRIQYFLAGQSSATTIAGISGSPGISATQLNRPYGILLDSQLNLYVADNSNNRVQIFVHYSTMATTSTTSTTTTTTTTATLLNPPAIIQWLFDGDFSDVYGTYNGSLVNNSNVTWMSPGYA
ncbi:unnamed protein product, partial [Adineta steineri]